MKVTNMKKFLVVMFAGALTLVGLQNAEAGRRCRGNCSGAVTHSVAEKHSVEQTTSKDETPAKDIVDVAVEAGSFKTLVTAVKAAGLVETLKGKGPFTVFAPTDEAFAKLPPGTVEALLKDKDKLKAVLTYHVVAGKVKAADVVKLKEAKTVQGGSVKITVADGKVKVDDANVVKTDIETANGVIHVIDAVILPK
ncbi:MAG: fasciclin domain-containing protein [Pirellulales bacterium]